MSEPKKITVRSYEGGSECDVPLDEFIKKIQENIPEAFKGTAEITIEGYEGVDVIVKYDRLETCEEQRKRELQEKKLEEWNKEREVRQLKELIQKYGVPNDNL
jgi:hypothetical protein